MLLNLFADMSCGQCSVTLSAVVCESITCVGPCKLPICRSCSGLTRSAVKVALDCVNLHFYCDKCNPYSIKEVSDALKEVKESIGKLNEVLSNATKLNSGTVMSPMFPPIHFESGSTSALKRRRVDNSSSTQRSASPNRGIIVGSCTTATLQTVESRKCVVASMLHPTTKIDDLTKYLSKALNLPDGDSSLRCSLLLPAGRDIKDLDFISFKIGMPESKFSLLLSPEIWPRGVKVRPFIPKFGSRPVGITLPLDPLVISAPMES